ncbi:MAG TPA: hypothetical protein VFT66_25760 [Roseiflexaceae bacterium]|jgi:hypothetical protein|nr:hypothetical protein [Roseiflexaceae bacterium]
MSPGFFILFLLSAALLVGVVVILWRYWREYANITPEEEAFDKRVANLNERQANRLSNDQLAQSVSEEDAWKITLRRGAQARRRARYADEVRQRYRERR